MYYAYLFEAKYLQTYIFATNKLREIVGASEQLISLTESLLDECLNALAIKDDIQFSRRAGGSFYAFSTNQNAIEHLSKLWPILVQQHVPNMTFTDALDSGKDASEAFNHAHKLLLENVNQQKVSLPSGNPFVEIAPRTGALATSRHKQTLIDTATKRKLSWYEQHGQKTNQRFLTANMRQQGYVWPINLTPEKDDDVRDAKDFPFDKKTSRIALIHADGNGMGQLLMDLREKLSGNEAFIDIFYAFSQALERATQEAAQQASDAVLKNHAIDTVLPARPIILGGDDLTIIVRADLAIAFTQAFLTAFETATKNELTQLWKDKELTGLANKLSACAGIVYAKPSQPIAQLAILAESLCGHAKKHAKTHKVANDIPSSLTFYRLTNAQIDDVDNIINNALSVTKGTEKYIHTLESYAINNDSKSANIDQLYALARVINNNENSQGAMRSLLGLIGFDSAQAIQHYARWRSVTKERNENLLKDFDTALTQLFACRTDLPYPPCRTDLPYSQGTLEENITQYRSPIGDVQTLMAENDFLLSVVQKTGVATA